MLVYRNGVFFGGGGFGANVDKYDNIVVWNFIKIYDWLIDWLTLSYFLDDKFQELCDFLGTLLSFWMLNNNG